MNSDWQPIETAPKDGSPVLLYHTMCDNGYQDVGYWDEKFHTNYDEWSEEKMEPSYRGGWTAGAYAADEELVELFPSHWMPLPNPPTLRGTHPPPR